MLVGAAILLAFQFGAEWIATRLRLPLSGPVLGMALLTLLLAPWGRAPHGLTKVSSLLLKAMPLFFIPAGVGILVLSDQFHTAWLPITAALLGSTLVAMAATAIVMKGVAKLLARPGSKHSP
jgi:holin-like protein